MSSVISAAHRDAFNFHSRIDLKNVSEAEARILMSAEHKALVYRPPPGSLAAEAQAAAAAKHPRASTSLIPQEQLTKAALEDAERIKSERAADGVDLSAVGEAQARKLMSEEHKALGHRPPAGSLAVQAQEASKHANGAATKQLSIQVLQHAALEDAATVEGGVAAQIDLNFVGQAEARRLMSEEHKALGYRPPQGSLAAAAQAAAAKHPFASARIDPATLTKAALEDARKIEAERRASQSSEAKPIVDLDSITPEEARKLQSEEQKALGYRPPSDSLAAQVQSVADKRAEEQTATGASLSPRLESALASGVVGGSASGEVGL